MVVTVKQSTFFKMQSTFRGAFYLLEQDNVYYK
jgi:hypothetical protein